MSLYSQLSDFELIHRLRSGEEAAFRHIYDRYWEQLYIIARNRLNDPQESEEIVQEIFLDFWSRKDSFELEKGLGNYFAVAVKFKVINRLARRAHAAKYKKEYVARHSEADNSFLSLLDYKELKQQLAALIAALPEKCRLVFQLRHEQGYSLREISDELGISEKTVEAHLTRARKTLRGALNLLCIIYMISQAG
jgi:RNA polymerase sigma-70 factor (family 1)